MFLKLAFIIPHPPPPTPHPPVVVFPILPSSPPPYIYSYLLASYSLVLFVVVVFVGVLETLGAEKCVGEGHVADVLFHTSRDNMEGGGLC